MKDGALYFSEPSDQKRNLGTGAFSNASRDHLRRRNFGGYRLAAVCVAGALILRALFDRVWGDRLPYAWFYLAVLIVARFAGIGPQIATAAAGLILGDFFFVQPRHSIFIEEPVDQINTMIYCGLSSLTILVAAQARHNTQRELAARDRMIGILECTSDAVCTLNQLWQVTYYNQRACELTNIDIAQVLGRNYWQLWPELVGTRFETEYRSVIDDRRRVHFEEFHPRDKRWIEVHACPYDDGIAIFFRDVSDRKQADATRARLAAIVESSDDAIMGESQDGLISTWNAAAERLYGYSSAEAIGRSFDDLFRIDASDQLLMLLGKVRTGEHVNHFETIQRTKNGKVVNVSLTISPVRTEASRIIGVSIKARDISGRKRHEAEREALIKQLQSALSEVKTLSGLLPICAQCKKIRDDQGYWNQIEAFIGARSNAKFSHGLCPDCQRRLYPELFQ